MHSLLLKFCLTGVALILAFVLSAAYVQNEAGFE